MPDLDRLTTALSDRYTIEREIGSGGMATVYLAEDVKHHRQVAVKVLRPELAAALGAERFLREIEIAAQLTHPHILPLHDSGEAEGFLYYVMPFVEGQSVRERLAQERELPVAEAVRILRDVVDALTQAHEHGVVHRDIKPDNVMLSGRHALVTDFGVAKAVSEATGAHTLTSEGVALGTPAYMSPEQAMADTHIDHRADIYAVGVLAYELLTGRTPFLGTTPQMMLAAHVTDTPEPVGKYRPAVSPALERVVMRCLEKKAADRWQSAEELLPQLEALATPSGGMTPTDTRPVAVVAGGRHWLVPGVLAAALLIVIVVVILQLLAPSPITITTSNITQVTRERGLEFQPAISPDGKEVAYVVGPIGNPRIVVRSTIEVGGGGELRPAEEEPGQHSLPAWTPDGASLRFFAFLPGQGWDWKEVAKLGGAVRTITRPWPGSQQLSPDGLSVVFARNDSIFTYPADHGETELLGVHTFERSSQHSFAWSPDGRRIAYVDNNPRWLYGANVANASIWVLDAIGGEPVPVTDREHMNLSPQWLADSRHLLFVSNRDGPRGIYVVDVGPEGPRGPPRSVLSSSDPHSISVSGDGKRLAYAKFTATQNIWSIPIPRTGLASIRDVVPVTTGNQVVEAHGVSPDGEWIAYGSDIRDEFAIYKQRLAGGQPQLVAEMSGYAFEPDWAPDGTEIAFHAHAEEATGEFVVSAAADVYLVSANGGIPERLTAFPGHEAYADWSPDGRTLAMISQGPDGASPFQTWIVSRDSIGGRWSEPVQLTEFYCSNTDWAPDGASVLCDAGDEFVRVSAAGEVLARLGLSSGLVETRRPNFSLDGSRIYFTATHEDGSRGVWWIPAAGGEAAKIVAFDDPAVWVSDYLSVGRDHLYLTIAEYESDIWVMDLEW